MIYCCKGCVAPKRYPGCHSVCPEYLAQKAEYDKQKAEYDKQHGITAALMKERGNKVYKALKGYRCNKYREK